MGPPQFQRQGAEPPHFHRQERSSTSNSTGPSFASELKGTPTGPYVLQTHTHPQNFRGRKHSKFSPRNNFFEIRMRAQLRNARVVRMRYEGTGSEEVRQAHAHAPCGRGARRLIACFTYHVYCMYHVRPLCICK